MCAWQLRAGENVAITFFSCLKAAATGRLPSFQLYIRACEQLNPHFLPSKRKKAKGKKKGKKKNLNLSALLVCQISLPSAQPQIHVFLSPNPNPRSLSRVSNVLPSLLLIWFCFLLQNRNHSQVTYLYVFFSVSLLLIWGLDS